MDAHRLLKVFVEKQVAIYIINLNNFFCKIFEVVQQLFFNES